MRALLGLLLCGCHVGGGSLPTPRDLPVNCAGVGARVDTARVEEGLRSGRYGCIKIHLGYVHQLAYDPACEPAYQLAEKYDVPVVFHTGDACSDRAKLKYADPRTVAFRRAVPPLRRPRARRPPAGQGGQAPPRRSRTSGEESSSGRQ